jgi:nitric oxide reductase NorQ protein
MWGIIDPQEKIMAKYYFYKSVKEKDKIRVNPLENQTHDTIGKIDPSFNVACSSLLRESYKPGTIFVSNDIAIDSTGKYYKASIKTKFRVLETTMIDEALEYEKLTGIKFVKSSFSLFDEIDLDKTLAAPESMKDGFYMSSTSWKLLVRNIKRHVNTMILGPSGTGKTSCIKEVCKKMGLELHIFDMGSMIDPVSSLLGVHRLDKGGSVFDYAKFTQVIQKPCVILLDELNRASLGCNNILFPCLDDRRKLSIEIASEKGVREISVHPDVTFIATCNIGSEYSGTNALDRALVDRFFPLELGYIPENEEKQVLITRTGVPADKAELIVKIANNIRSMVNKNELSTSVSIREALMIASLVHDGMPLGQSLEQILLPMYEGTTTEGERSTVSKLIASY